ncbi:MAG: undecaprenyl-diphosphate phosphatase [Candidatus Abyssubacteria bacterium]
MQGVTEFLPISSSGHLVIFQALFGMEEPQVLFDVMLHVGTLAAILIVFRSDVVQLLRSALRIAHTGKLGDGDSERMVVAIIVGCVPTVIMGVLFSEHVERLFASPTAAGIGLIVTGCILMTTFQRNTAAVIQPLANRVGFLHALAIGAAQGVALAPGISRSGTTIAVALLLGLPRELAARFSFLLAAPAIVGALLFEMKDYSPGNPGSHHIGYAPMLAGAFVAALSGIIALVFLLRVVKRGKLSNFAYYCWAVGLLTIALSTLRG